MTSRAVCSMAVITLLLIRRALDNDVTCSRALDDEKNYISEMCPSFHSSVCHIIFSELLFSFYWIIFPLYPGARCVGSSAKMRTTCECTCGSTLMSRLSLVVCATRASTIRLLFNNTCSQNILNTLLWTEMSS